MAQRWITAGETLAIDPTALMRGADGFFWLALDSVPQSRRHEMYEDVSIVYVRGSLEHHADAGGDNYEGILARVKAAMSGEDVCEDGGDPLPPSAVILCIDSKGGVVAGLNETVKAIQQLRKAPGAPKLVAYVNEMAASAAYALACSCEEILCPPSAILGSIGTISTMISCAEKDKADGLDVRLITSGARKADGHPHTPISDAAVEAERDRVEKLASSFFQLASKARGVAADKLQNLQAAIFLGPDAKKQGLADAVMSLDDVAMGLSAMSAPAEIKAKGNDTDRRMSLDRSGKTRSTSAMAQTGTVPVAQKKGIAMPVQLAALIAKTEAAIASATSPLKKARLERDLAAYRFASMRAESDGDDDEDDDEDDDDEDSKSAKAAKKAEEAKKAAEAAKHRAKAAEYRKKAEEAEEKAKSAEEDDEKDEEEEEEEEASLHSEQPAAIAAVMAQNEITKRELRALRAKVAKAEQSEMIATALSAGSITPAESKMLAGKTPSWAKEYIDTRKGMRVVPVDEGHLLVPSGQEQAASASEIQEINERISALGLTDEKQVAKLRTEMIANRRKQTANGAGERY